MRSAAPATPCPYVCAAGRSLRAEDFKAAGLKAEDLKAAGLHLKELKEGGYTATELREGGFGLHEIKGVGYTPAELNAAGFSATELSNIGYSGARLDEPLTNSPRLMPCTRSCRPRPCACVCMRVRVRVRVCDPIPLLAYLATLPPSLRRAAQGGGLHGEGPEERRAEAGARVQPGRAEDAADGV